MGRIFTVLRISSMGDVGPICLQYIFFDVGVGQDQKLCCGFRLLSSHTLPMHLAYPWLWGGQISSIYTFSMHTVSSSPVSYTFSIMSESSRPPSSLYSFTPMSSSAYSSEMSERQSLERLLRSVLDRLVRHMSAVSDLILCGDLSLLFGAVSWPCPAYNKMWKKAAADCLIAICRYVVHICMVI